MTSPAGASSSVVPESDRLARCVPSAREFLPASSPLAPGKGLSISISRRWIIVVLSARVGILAVAHGMGQYSVFVLNRAEAYGTIDRFHLDGEANIPSWYAALLLLACAVVFGLIPVAKRSERDPFARHWAEIALILLCMCADEGAQPHEMPTRPTRELADGAVGWLRSRWVVPGAILAPTVGLV